MVVTETGLWRPALFSSITLLTPSYNGITRAVRGFISLSSTSQPTVVQNHAVRNMTWRSRGPERDPGMYVQVTHGPTAMDSMFLYLTWPLHQEGHLERKKHNTITPAYLKGVLLNCYSLLPYTGTQLPHLLVNFWHKPAISSSPPLLSFNSAFSWNNPTIVIISTFKAMISLAQGVFWP